MRPRRSSLCKSLLLSAALGYSGLFLFAAEAQAVSVSINNFRGNWTATAAYRAGDVVGYQSQSYIAQTANRGWTPSATSQQWYLLAAQGPKGDAGTDGTNGTNGTNGIDGINGAPGPKPVYAYSLVVGQNPPGGDGTGRTLAAPDYTTITAALAAIPATTDTSGACTAHYLVKVLPGVYSEKVAMKPCVDIEGSGELTTRITANGGDSISGSATVVGADQTELRSISVETSGGALGIAYYIVGASSVRITQVSLSASGTNQAFGFLADAVNLLADSVTIIASAGNVGREVEAEHGANVTLRDSQITASGTGVIFNPGLKSGSTATISGSTVAAQDSVSVDSGNVFVFNSKLSSQGGTLRSLGPSAVMKIANSMIDGPVLFSNFGSTCVGAYNGNFAPLNAQCQ